MSRKSAFPPSYRPKYGIIEDIDIYFYLDDPAIGPHSQGHNLMFEYFCKSYNTENVPFWTESGGVLIKTQYGGSVSLIMYNTSEPTRHDENVDFYMFLVDGDNIIDSDLHNHIIGKTIETVREACIDEAANVLMENLSILSVHESAKIFCIDFDDTTKLYTVFSNYSAETNDHYIRAEYLGNSYDINWKN